jgi:hypothetical protein
MTTIGLSSVPHLDGTNYHDWKFGISMLLRRAGIYSIVCGDVKKTDEDKTWDKNSEEGLVLIGLSIDPSQYSYIRDATTGPEAWKALSDVYEKNSRANRISLKRQFYSFTHDIGRGMQGYITGISNLAAQLKSIGVTLTDEDIADVLIFNLDETYSSIAASLSAQKDLTLADVKGALVDEEARRGGANGDQALVGKSKRHISRCFNCGKEGHIARYCRSPKKDTAAAASDDYTF